MINETQKIINKFNKYGTVTIDGSFLFDKHELEQLNQLTSKLPLEYVQVGDANEKNNVFVGRLMEDTPREYPKLRNHQYSWPLLMLLYNNRSKTLFKKLLSGKGYIRRIQVNKMKTNSFIGFHLDTDSNPDYYVSIVIQLGKSFEGGNFVLHYKNNKKWWVKPSFKSITISRCDIPHEVEKVTHGERVSLVYFLSKNPTENRKNIS